MAFTSYPLSDSIQRERFAVYAGSGIFLNSYSTQADRTRGDFAAVHFGPVSSGVASLSRSEAVRVCHAARRAGVSAWVARHPLAVA